MRRLLAIAILCLPLAASAQDPRAMRAWKAKCVSCHGEDGKGNTGEAKKLGGLRDLSSAEVQKRFDDAKLKELIAKGVKEKDASGKEKEMPANPDIAGPQLEGLVKIVRGLVK